MPAVASQRRPLLGAALSAPVAGSDSVVGGAGGGVGADSGPPAPRWGMGSVGVSVPVSPGSMSFCSDSTASKVRKRGSTATPTRVKIGQRSRSGVRSEGRAILAAVNGRRSLLAAVAAGAAAAVITRRRRTREQAAAPAPVAGARLPSVRDGGPGHHAPDPSWTADEQLVADLLVGHPHVMVGDHDGLLVDDAAGQPVERRSEWGETLWRLTFGMLRRHGIALTGLDATRMRFLDDGRVALGAVGAVEHVDPVALVQYDGLVRAALASESAELPGAITEVSGDLPEAAPIDRLHRVVGALVDGLGATPPVAAILAELWQGAEPATPLGRAERDWWESRRTVALLDRWAAPSGEA